MLFDILRFAVYTAAFAAVFLIGARTYSVGYSDGRREREGKPPVKEPFFPIKKKGKQAENTPYYDDILSNIDAYDGTETGQKKVRRK